MSQKNGMKLNHVATIGEICFETRLKNRKPGDNLSDESRVRSTIKKEVIFGSY